MDAKKVPLREGAENARYYKYYLEDIAPVSKEEKDMIARAKGGKGEGLEPEDRALIQSDRVVPARPGYYRLKKGGLLVHSVVPIPDITGEMMEWWAPWHSLDPLRYAIWDPEDHYDIKLSEEGRRRALDPSIPPLEKLWGASHTVSEAFYRDEPQDLTMHFQNPFECGYSRDVYGTPNCRYILASVGKMNDKIPVFMTEIFREIDGVMHVQLYFWIGYALEGGQAKCKIPKFIKVPKNIAQMLMTHNYKEYHHLNKILPRIYAEEKDNWEDPLK